MLALFDLKQTKKSDAVSLKEVNSIKFMLLFKGGSINETIANLKVIVSS